MENKLEKKEKTSSGIILKTGMIPRIGSCIIAATNYILVCREKFVRNVEHGNTLSTPGLKIMTISFCEEIWNKIEKPQEPTELTFYDLPINTLLSQVINPGGGLEKIASTMSDVWAMMNKQPNGEEGNLLTSGWNMFFVEGVESEDYSRRDLKHFPIILVWQSYKTVDYGGWHIFSDDSLNIYCSVATRVFLR